MGNSSTKEAAAHSSSHSHSRQSSVRTLASPNTAGFPASASSRAGAGGGGGGDDAPLSPAGPAASGRRGSRPDFLVLGSASATAADRDGAASAAASAATETRRETRAEREARKLVRERQLREKEREQSLQEESVDAGYLVTLGTYTGPEDFSKPVVRQLMVGDYLAGFG